MSGLERLRARPRKLTATELLDALLRLRDVRAGGVGQIRVDLPPRARIGPLRPVAKAQALRCLGVDRL